MRARIGELVGELLAGGAAQAAESADALAEYGRLIQHYGARINLVGDRSDDFVATQLIGGSLALLRVARPSGRLVDVGSGAGLPGIPLAIACPGLAVDLVEVRGKRAAFLRRAISLLGLAGLRVLDSDVTEVAGGYDWAVARAFKAPVSWLPIGRRLVRAGGRIGVYTTRALWAEAAGALPDGLAVQGTAPDPTGPDRIVVVVGLDPD